LQAKSLSIFSSKAGSANSRLLCVSVIVMALDVAD
jgi:hypothetical protein